jgi:DNA-binding CsgD family transcriptional regulator
MRLPARIVLAKVAGRRGYDDADALLQIALGEALATGEMQYIVPVRMGRAESFWLTNRDAAARAELEALAALRLAGLDCWELGELAVWWQRCGMAAPFPGEGLEMAAPRAAELAGDHFGAAELWLARGLPYEAALCLSHASGATGDQALRRAVAMLDELAATPVAAMARRRARSLGLEQIPGKPRGPYAARRAHPLGLTAKELRVMRLIADGLSNQAIAERLSRSPRTVEHHVSAVLANLNARTRMDVMLRLRSEPWLLPDPPAVPDEL